MNDRSQELKRAEKGAYISIAAYIFLSLMKIIVSQLANSQALFADGLNNLTDIIGSVTVLIGLRLARRPPDQEHRYGHWKIESVASMITSFIMLAIGLQVIISAVQKFIANEIMQPDPLAAIVSVVSAIVMVAVYQYNAKLAKKVNSSALMAAAKDNLSDAWVSGGTAIAILTAQLQMPWLDGGMALIIGILIIITAIGIFKEAAFSLSDGFDEKQLQEYRKTIMTIDGIESIRSIKGRTYGANIYLDLVITVCPDMSVADSHCISDCVEELLVKSHQVFETRIHIEPANPSELKK